MKVESPRGANREGSSVNLAGDAQSHTAATKMVPAPSGGVVFGDALAELATDAQTAICQIKALAAAIEIAIDLMGSIDNEAHRLSVGHIAAYAMLISATAERADATCIEVERRGYDARPGGAA